MTTQTILTTNPPETLNGYETASEAWRRIIGIYGTHGKTINAFAEALLSDYCMLVEEEKEAGKLIAKEKSELNNFLETNIPNDEKQAKAFQKVASDRQKILHGLEEIPAKKRKLANRFAKDLFLSDALRQEIEAEMVKLINE